MKHLSIKAALLLGAAAAAGCGNMKQIKHQPYPETVRGDVVDNYFGTEVPDPYRWLEDDNSEATAAWVAAENAVTQDYLSQIPFRGAIRERLTEVWNYAKESAPRKHGDWWYYTYNDGLQNQSVIYRTKEPGEAGEVFLDPNKLSDDGTVALTDMSFSKDGRWLAYSAAASGSDWVEIRVMDTADKSLAADKIEWVKFSGARWAPDSKGFYYSAYDAPKQNAYSSKNEFQKVYYHALGTPQSADRLIYEDREHPLRYFSAWPSEDGKWLFVIASEGTSGMEVLYKRVSDPKFRVLLPGFDADYSPVDCKDDRLYYVTNRDASNYALMKVDLNRPGRIETVIPESERNLLEGVGTAGGSLFAYYLQDAQSRIYQYDYAGKQVREVVLPAIGSVDGFDGREEDSELYYTLVNYTAPATIYKYDIASGESTLYKAPEVNFDPELFTTEQVFYTSKDGTKVPMFITRRKDMKRDGKNPCLLYAYGGFQINQTPKFKPSELMFVEQGGIYCVANLRGGSEYGEEWHKAGMLENKQNVFDDFIMLRYHKFTIGWGWAVEYGSSEDEEQFSYIYKYSPLHNIKEGVKYPATLVTTADHDDRVVPAHSFKFAAAMQHAQAGDAPILIRIESKAGHGAGKPTSKRIDEAADMYAFLFQNIGVPYREIEN